MAKKLMLVNLAAGFLVTFTTLISVAIHRFPWWWGLPILGACFNFFLAGCWFARWRRDAV